MKDGIYEENSIVQSDSNDEITDRHEYINILRRHIQDNPKRALMARHRMWMDNLVHEYPMPYIPYRIGVYIRYYNQTRHENYIEKHKQQFIDDIAMCPKWKLVDFYIDKGTAAPHMENSKEWCRLLEDCFLGRVNLIVTQKVSSVSSDSDEMTFLSRVLAAQKRPVGIYFISEDIYTLASYLSTHLLPTIHRTFTREASFLRAGKYFRRMRSTWNLWEVIPAGCLEMDRTMRLESCLVTLRGLS